MIASDCQQYHTSQSNKVVINKNSKKGNLKKLVIFSLPLHKSALENTNDVSLSVSDCEAKMSFLSQNFNLELNKFVFKYVFASNHKCMN